MQLLMQTLIFVIKLIEYLLIKINILGQIYSLKNYRKEGIFLENQLYIGLTT